MSWLRQLALREKLAGSWVRVPPAPGLQLGAPTTGRFYGGDGTIHANADLDVEVHLGIVTAVWFRCQPLPFTVTDVDIARGVEMRRMYAEGAIPAIVGVEVVDS